MYGEDLLNLVATSNKVPNEFGFSKRAQTRAVDWSLVKHA